MIDWDTIITLTIGFTIGWALGATASIAWYWFPLMGAAALLGMVILDLSLAGIRRLIER